MSTKGVQRGPKWDIITAIMEAALWSACEVIAVVGFEKVLSVVFVDCVEYGHA